MAHRAHTKLKQLIAGRLEPELPDGLERLAGHARAAHEPAVVAVLAYGSCLRAGSLEDGIADLYVILSDYRSAHDTAFARWGNQLAPPNVYYLAVETKTGTLRAKYATVSLDQLRGKCSARTENPYFWARFAQPSALVWAKDEATREAIIEILSSAVETMLTKAAPLVAAKPTAHTLWRTALANTYRTEWRPEPDTRIDQLIAADKPYYTEAARAVFGPGLNISADIREAGAARRAWARRRFAGKALTIARLIKASFTFQGGADYLTWKIERHSGRKITLSAWQRRHPLLAGLYLLPKLWARGVLR